MAELDFKTVENYLAEWSHGGDPNDGWSGPVSDIVYRGPRIWHATWRNNHGDIHQLIITLSDPSSIVIDEEGNQHWRGAYKRSGNTYAFSGRGIPPGDDRFDFAGVLTLEEPGI